ncbi:MAG: hypothetical protein R3B70_46570 [Polyangiaceae bacterium]
MHEEIVCAQSPTLAGERDVRSRLIAAFGTAGSGALNHLLRFGHLEWRLTTSDEVVGLPDWAHDIRDVLDVSHGAGDAVAAFTRASGILYFFDPARSEASSNARAVRRLDSTVEAVGRRWRTAPVVVIVPRWRGSAADELKIEELRQLVEHSASAVFEVDGETLGGMESAVLQIYQVLQNARARTEAGRKPDECAMLPCLEVNHDWGSAPPSESRLLEAWRACRSTDVAELLDALLYRHRLWRPARLTHDAWIAIGRRRDARSLPLLLDTLFSRHPGPDDLPDGGGHDGNGSLAAHVVNVLERIQCLKWWEEEPRMTPRLASAMVDLNRYRRQSVWTALANLLISHRDPRSIAVGIRMTEAGYAVRDPMFNTIGLKQGLDLTHALKQRFSAGVPTTLAVPMKHRAVWQAMVERITRPLPRLDDTLSIAAHPHDIEHRRALAARMHERGDPRGRFIQLQIRKSTSGLTPEEHHEEQALGRTYAWDWLGPLADVVDVENCQFELGYPARLTVWTSNPVALRNVIGRPEWATVREIQWGGDPCRPESEPPAELVRHPVMRSLESVSTKTPEDPQWIDALRRVAWAR